MNLSQYSGENGLRPSYASRMAIQMRPEDGMQAKLERSSSEYLLEQRTTEDVLSDLYEKVRCLVSRHDPEDFEAELAHLVMTGREGLVSELLSQFSGQSTSSPDQCAEALIEIVLARVIGSKGARRFLDGLPLLSWRNLLAIRHAKAVDEKAPFQGRVVEIPDPDIWALSFDTTAGDVCFAAVLTLLARRDEIDESIGYLLAERFCKGQRAGVQVLASILAFSDEEHPIVNDAIHFAGVEIIEIDERYEKAQQADVAIHNLIEIHGKRSVFTPFAEDDEDCPDEDYPDENPDEWVALEG